MMSAPRSARIAATVLLPEPMPPVSPMTTRAAMRAVGSAIVRASRDAPSRVAATPRLVRCTTRVPSDRFEMRVALPQGGGVSAGVALARGHAAGRSPIVVLAPGAGSSRNHASLAGIQTGLADAGWTTVTFDFPYREAGRRIPDRQPVLERCWRAVLDAVQTDARLAPPWIAIGGRSMGGRIASHVAAAGAPVNGLVFLGFPLHPAGRPGVERVAHLPSIAVPMLFVQGARDALA